MDKTRLNVSSIQHFCVGDGPGIRTTVFLKGCNLHCPWCHNPETILGEPQELYYESTKESVFYGTKMSVSEILEQVLEDKDFYKQSGGGATISGGEPLLQSEGLQKLLECLKQNGISTLIDTAADVPWENFERIRAFTDVFYFDVKTASVRDYLEVIGANANRICENLKRLTALGHRVHVRIPLIPNFNTSEQSVLQICTLLTDCGVKYVDLLPFHRLGSAKYEALGKPYAYKDTKAQDQEEIIKIANIYRRYFEVTVE